MPTRTVTHSTIEGAFFMAKITQIENEPFNEVKRHYDLAKEALEARYTSFNTADELFRSYIDEDNWPYSSLIFIPKVFTAIFEKTSRLIGKKPTGRLIPREGGDVIGAKINNEILMFQWDDTARIDGTPLIAKWSAMDMNARKYGASFALVKWHYERKIEKETKDGKLTYKSTPYFDGPNMQVLNNRDVLCNPSYSSIKNWFQYREYLTYNDLMGTNDASRGEPIYKNLSELMDKMKKDMKSADRRDSNYTSKNMTIDEREDYLGSDLSNKVIEIVTEYRPNRWITFAPRHGVIIRDIPNPYQHQEIPVVCLKYYAIDDDIYGLPEWESIEKMQKGLNAITSQYIDAVNLELHSPIGVDSTRVRMHTLEMGPDKKWLTTGDPRTAITKYDFGSPSAIGAFKTTYSVFTGEIAEGLGETSAMTSNMNPLQTDKTATEIKDLASQRLSRDNYNQIFLGEAIKRQIYFWFSMNQQFFFEPGEQSRIQRITGKDSLAYFDSLGMGEQGLTDEATNTLIDAETQGMPVDNPQDFQTPLYPVETPEGIMPKFNMAPQGDYGELLVEPFDLQGSYDYIVDMSTMQPPNEEQIIASKKAAIDLMLNPQTQMMMQQQGKTIKMSELLEDYLETIGFKDAGKYFEQLQVQQPYGIDQTGGGIPPQGIAGGGINQANGMVPPQGNVGGQNPQFMGGPQQV